MSSRSKSKSIVGNGPGKAVDLAADAMAMEAKLLELRRAMEVERAKRESLVKGAGGSSIWRNGGSGLLRSNFRAKQGTGPASASSSEPQTSTSSRVTSARTTSRDEAPMDQLGLEPGTMLAGARITAPSMAPQPSPWGNTAQHQQADILNIQEGMGCGTDGSEDLLAGQFDEADSHRSFLDALNEWRHANRQQQRPASPEQASAAAEGAVMEVQTETAGPSHRPPSAKVSYFNKLILNQASKQAGQDASSAVPCANPASSAAGSSSTTSRAQPHTSSSHNQHDVDSRISSTPESSSSGGSGDGGTVSPEQEGRAEGQGQGALALLDKLDQLERAMQGDTDDDESDDEGGGAIEVVTQVAALGLTKGTRLPDSILLPNSCSSDGEDS